MKNLLKKAFDKADEIPEKGKNVFATFLFEELKQQAFLTSLFKSGCG